MKRTLLYICLTLLGCIPGLTQGLLQGTITNERHDALTGANIRLTESEQGQVSDAAGRYHLGGILPGSYHAVISFIGYESQRIAIDIRDRETFTLDVILKTGSIQLSDVLVTADPDRPINTLSQIDIRFRPINTAQDILRMVPGLFIAQHAGGGKAEQIFLRGFDCDHGTDINVDVDGLPVNMVSHAHGQGYADLHFLMPEMISYADFDKGPYFASKGDFTTAGYISFQTRNKLDRNFGKLEGGSFGTGRIAGGINLFETKKSNAFVVSEFFRSDGFFDNPQKFSRFNFHGKFNTTLTDRATLTFSFSAFDSHWNASGQIPDRAVADGTITRYGSIDPTEGGGTSRYNAYVKVVHSLGSGSLENQVYAVKYDFNLFSNFTFYLHDPINGDQINQKDSRWVFGYNTRYRNSSTVWGRQLKTDIGGGLRSDVINNITLDHTVKRTFLSHVMLGDIRELNLNVFVSETLFIADRFSVNAAVRLDYFDFTYNNKLSAQSGAVGRAIVNPKLNFNYQASQNVNIFIRSGTGFHSNDARVVVAQNGVKTLPRAFGLDLGADVKFTPKLLVHAALWRLDLDQEFVYVGDEGIVEPSGKTKRLGVDVSVRYQLNTWLFADVDVNATKPRSKVLPEGQNYIPLAPITTSIGGLSARRPLGFNGSLRYRYLADRAANEDYTLVAKGYFITDAIVNFTKPGYEVGFSIENVFNQRWKEAQFATESRLKNEGLPVDEIHFTPGTPFALKMRITKYF